MSPASTPASLREPVRELDRAECLEFLATTHFGRVVAPMPDGTPIIRPVNYLFDQPSQSVIFRTAPGSKLHALLTSRSAAFEIDGIDPPSKTGWSVIVSGIAEEVTDPADIKRLADASIRPWALRAPGHLIRIRAYTVTGRVVVSDAP